MHCLCCTIMQATRTSARLCEIVQALITLQNMYTNMVEQGTPAPNEAEFRAYQLILAMGQHGKYFYSATGFFASLKVCLRPN